jgi:hypothetical protein
MRSRIGAATHDLEVLQHTAMDLASGVLGELPRTQREAYHVGFEMARSRWVVLQDAILGLGWPAAHRHRGTAYLSDELEHPELSVEEGGGLRDFLNPSLRT